MSDLLRVHDWSYVSSIKTLCQKCTPLDGSEKFLFLDSDTVISMGTYTAALHAAGAVIEAIDQVV